MGASATDEDEEETVVHFLEHFRKVFPFLNESQVPDHQIRYIQFPSGNYTGQLNEIEEREGWGEMLWANGTLYGPNDIFYYSAGDKYFGQWKNDLQEGEKKWNNYCLTNILLFCFPN